VVGVWSGENFDAVVPAVHDKDVAGRVGRDAHRSDELAIAPARGAERREEAAEEVNRCTRWLP
jgi:hypothetical protein